MKTPNPSFRLLLAAGLVGSVLISALLPSVALAAPSTKTRSGGGGGGSNAMMGRDSGSATMVMRCFVTKIGAGGVVHMLPESGDAEEVIAKLPADVRIRAQDKNQFDGRKVLEVSDLKVGQRLRVTVLPSQERIVSLVVLKDKST